MKIRQTLLAALLAMPMLAMAATPVINVYKSATCGCCEGWIRHLRENGFKVEAHDVANPSDMREKMGMPDKLSSCHTAAVEGYAIEGHVPAADIKRLLAAKPKAKGLAVPAMPLGSPGMEGPRKDAYDVYLVLPDGSPKVYRHYN
ncbi:DUF411 domain-containing protein [Pseudoduganella eburnea]|uniref:DUF411 domain-containing protein n=1 Tax=Massilia eburnea TaxID=1776165 RepID=A0A6L6QPW2_9BURK|nr:DUF411 domain-containing protein [Massilia eburnea]MTW14389.1 DUF411 domain-containing protein [Massilia eburnea]